MDGRKMLMSAGLVSLCLSVAAGCGSGESLSGEVVRDGNIATSTSAPPTVTSDPTSTSPPSTTTTAPPATTTYEHDFDDNDPRYPAQWLYTFERTQDCVAPQLNALEFELDLRSCSEIHLQVQQAQFGGSWNGAVLRAGQVNMGWTLIHRGGCRDAAPYCEVFGSYAAQPIWRDTAVDQGVDRIIPQGDDVTLEIAMPALLADGNLQDYFFVGVIYPRVGPNESDALVMIVGALVSDADPPTIAEATAALDASLA